MNAGRVPSNPRSLRRAAVVPIGGLAFLLAACSSSRPIATPATLDVAAAPVLASTVFPAIAQEKAYAPFDASAGRSHRTLTPTLEPDGLEIRIVDRAGDERLLRLLRAADGSVLLAAAIEDGKTTLFDPPLVYMPAALGPGREFEATTDVRVVDARGREKSRGTAVRRLRHAGTATIDWESAGSQATVLEGVLDLDLSPARALTTTTLWITPEGIEREAQRTQVRVFGVVIESRSHDVVRIREPGGTP